MEALKLLETINNHYVTAIAFHREMADSNWFMSFPGFALLHEYQHIDESISQRKVKKWIIDNHYVGIYDKLDGGPDDNEFRKFSDGKSRFSITASDKWTFLQESWNDYRNWEKSSFELYQSISKELFDNGNSADAIFVNDLIKDVSIEFSELVDILLAMQGMEWDVPTITSMQPELRNKYQSKIKKLYKEIQLGEV